MNVPEKKATLGMSKFSNRGASIVTSTNNLEAKMPATSNGVGVVQNPNHPKKSVYVAYFLWLFGGIFGMHHYYLGRDRHGFVWWTTLGGFGVGWLGEVMKVRKYVMDANEDEKFMAELIRKMQRYPKLRKPPPLVHPSLFELLMTKTNAGAHQIRRRASCVSPLKKEANVVEGNHVSGEAES